MVLVALLDFLAFVDSALALKAHLPVAGPSFPSARPANCFQPARLQKAWEVEMARRTLILVESD